MAVKTLKLDQKDIQKILSDLYGVKVQDVQIKLEPKWIDINGYYEEKIYEPVAEINMSADCRTEKEFLQNWHETKEE